MNKDIEADKMGNTRLTVQKGNNMVGEFTLAEPVGPQGRYVIMETDADGVKTVDGSYGPALGLKEHYVAAWRAVADAWANGEPPAEEPAFPADLGGTLAQVSRERCETLLGSFGSLAELAGVLSSETSEKARLAALASPPERAEEISKAAEASRRIAEMLVAKHKDEVSGAGGATVPPFFGQRIVAIPGASPAEQRQTFHDVRDYLASRGESGLTTEDVALAVSTARALEYAENDALAAEAYRSLAGLLAARKDEKLSSLVGTMEASALRLELVGKELELTGTTLGGSKFGWGAYQGKVVLLYFSADSAAAASAELTSIRRLYDLYRDRGFCVLEIRSDDSGTSGTSSEKEQSPWPTLHGAALRAARSTAPPHGVMAVPMVLMVDSKGRLVSVGTSHLSVMEFLQRELGPPYATTPPPKPLTNSIGMKLVPIPPGEFEMGSTDAEIDQLLKLARTRQPDMTWYHDRVLS